MTDHRFFPFALALLLPAGCSPFTQLPRLASPGNAVKQQLEAVYHDPYPLDDLGPAVVGGRPRGFARPVPETKRGRLLPGAQTVVPRGVLQPGAAPATLVPPTPLPPGAFAPLP